MPQLVWGNPTERRYESGLDRGVLYLPDGSAVPWNGLITVEEKFNKDVEEIYFDGRKISVLVTPGDFAATMKAVNYPPEFDKLESMAHLRRGVRVHDQPPGTFALSWRTFKGTDVGGAKAAYKLNLAYNLTAIPSDRSYETGSDDPSLVEFEWELSSIPEDIPGFRPTAHICVDSDEVDPWLLEDIEEKLYGSQALFAELPPMQALVEFMAEWTRVTVVDNGDGTWTATERRPGFLTVADGHGVQRLDHVNAYFTDEDLGTYVLADTKERVDRLDIRLNGNGTWTATTETDITIVDGAFTLTDVDPVLSGPNVFRIKSKS